MHRRPKLVWDSHEVPEAAGGMLPGAVERLDRLAATAGITREEVILKILNAADQGLYREGHRAREFMASTFGPAVVEAACASIHESGIAGRAPADS